MEAKPERPVKRYGLRRIRCREELDTVPALRVDQYRWLAGYEPEVRVQAALLEGESFIFRMICLENHPKAVYTDADSPVCRDSCMECFVNFAPERDARYLNLEANALGALHGKIGAGRGDRVALRALGVPMPTVSAQVKEGAWQMEFTVPLGCVEALYGPCDLSPGRIFRANFYKCGDETERPHYGMWSPVETKTPDFHRPEFFGELELL